MRFDIDESSKNFPTLLKELKNECPPILYCNGNEQFDFNVPCVSVVGSRKATSYGLNVLEELIFNLVSNKFCVVSGFMYGIDAFVHELTLNLGGYTIAVLPAGVFNIIPSSNLHLYERIVCSNSVVISEYLESIPPKKYVFPRRNRIVAGISFATIVIESDVVGGSIVTAKLANNYKRLVFAIPGSIFNQMSLGCHKLVSENISEIYYDFETFLSKINEFMKRDIVNVI